MSLRLRLTRAQRWRIVETWMFDVLGAKMLHVGGSLRRRSEAGVFVALRSRLLGIGLPSAGALLVLGSFAFGYIPDAEDFNSTALTTRLFMQAVLNGDNPFWTELLGLGMPQPFRISLVQHPLGVLFALTKPLAAVKIVVVVQGLAGLAFVWLICRQLGMLPLVAGTCALSWIMSWSSVEFLHFDDFFSAFLSFSLLPLICWAWLELAREQPGRRALGLGIMFGTLAGLLVATGLVSHISSYLLVLASFVLARPNILSRHWLALLLSAAFFLVIASGVVLLLIVELVRSSEVAARSAHSNPDLLAHLRSALTIHLLEALGPAPIAALDKIVLADPHRTTGFGPVAFVLAICALPLRLGAEARPFKVALVTALVLMALPPSIFLGLITATWVFRDSVNFYGIVLAGLLATHVHTRRSASARIVVVGCAAQCLALLLVTLPPIFRTTEFALTPERRQQSTYWLREEGSFVRQLKAIVRDDRGRLLMSRDLSEQARRRLLFQDGMLSNVAALSGLRVVNSWARGIATGSLHPDLALLEGLISTTDANLADKPLLDLLGVSHVLAWEGEPVAAGLVKVGVIRLASGRLVGVWRNATAFPLVVEVDAKATELRPRAPRAECGHDRFLCRDLGDLHAMALGSATALSTQRAGRIVIQLEPESAGRERLLLVNTWYRPEWFASDSRVVITPLLDQLVGVRVPASVTSLTLTYRPIGLMLSYALGMLAILIGCMLSIALVVRRTSAAAPACVA